MNRPFQRLLQHSRYCLPILAVGLAACKKEAGESAGGPDVHGAQTQVSIPLPPPPAVLRPVRDQAYDIYLRASWTSAPANGAGMRPMGPVTTITLCQEPVEAACGAVEYAAVVDYLESMRKTALANGLDDIPYHFAVDRAGRVWQLRDLLYAGQHSPGRSAGNVGVLVLGSPYDRMTDLQRAATRRLIGVLSQKNGVLLKGVVGRDEIVKGDLPGADVKALIGEIRGAPGR